MKRRAKGETKELKVAFAVLAGRQGGQGIFASAEAAEGMARRTKLAHIAEQMASYERGYVGNRRRWPQCGRRQQYKGERTREVGFDGGTVTVVRAYYVCPGCGTPSCPLDAQLGLVEGKEHGRLREKLALLAVVAPYHQAPQVCQTLLGSEYHAMALRRVAVREAAHLTAGGHHQQLPVREQDRLYLEVDGHLCPTREPKEGPTIKGLETRKLSWHSRGPTGQRSVKSDTKFSTRSGRPRLRLGRRFAPSLPRSIARREEKARPK